MDGDKLAGGGPLPGGAADTLPDDLDGMSDRELIEFMQARDQRIARYQYEQVLATARYARRQQARQAAALAAGIPAGCAPGGFPGDELGFELVIARSEAGHRIDDALDLTSRLPRTLAGMAAGKIDRDRAGYIALYTRCLSDADAARADAVLAPEAPDLRVEQLIGKAVRLEMRLNPEGSSERRRTARRERQRVEVRREMSGNMSLAGREMDAAQALASESHLRLVAARMQRSGVFSGVSLGSLRVMALADLTQGRDPLDRIADARAAQAAGGAQPAHGAAAGAEPGGSADRPDDGPGPDTDPEPDDEPGSDEWTGPEGPPDEPPGPPSAPPGAGAFGPAPLPALVNLIIPAATLLGFSAAPGEAGQHGLLDRDEANDIARAAAAHPRTRWCVTLTAPDGTAIGHGCAHGRHPGILDDPATPPESRPPPPPSQQQLLADLIRRLGLTITPVARGSCDHATSEARYVPSRNLKHLVRARSATCDFPGCTSPAVQSDLDHTVAWPAGPTDQCNLAPRCRAHHRAKQAPDWNVEMTTPGVARWTFPSGRTHVTGPTRYDA